VHQRRLARTRRLFAFDRGLGSRLVAGADEAGRGCLAGPLVAAAVLIDYEGLSNADRRALAGLHDSKQMTAEKRAELYPCVLRAAERVSVVVRCARGIDDRGLHVTNIEALSVALERLRPEEETTCLVDGRFSLRDCAVPHRAVVEGDGKSAAIAAASVIAKVTRDRYMHGAGAEHPGWGFEEHVGYSTPEHREAIERIGISPLHRRSFQSVAYSQLELAG
jgi:ribonuclease HII